MKKIAILTAIILGYATNTITWTDVALEGAKILKCYPGQVQGNISTGTVVFPEKTISIPNGITHANVCNICNQAIGAHATDFELQSTGVGVIGSCPK